MVNKEFETAAYQKIEQDEEERKERFREIEERIRKEDQEREQKK